MKQEIIHSSELTQIELIDEESDNNSSIMSNNKPNRSKLYTFFATICMAGIQFIWTVELSRGTSYLSRLNLPDKITALVWLAGPLSGLITQPIVGALSDKCTLRLGKRRPFIIIGSILVCLAMLGVAFSKEIGGDASIVENYETYDNGKRKFKSSTLAIAILSFYILDFSLNAVQATCRSLIIDVHPLHQQERANAFAGNISSITNVIGYLIGSLDLVKYIPIVDEKDQDGQLKIFCFISILVFCITVIITCFFVNEHIVVSSVEQKNSSFKRKTSSTALFKYIWHALRRLPKSIQKLCLVQFFASMAWFPFLFYSSAWVTGLNNQVILSNRSTSSSSSDNETAAFSPKDLDQSDRVGSFALLLNSCVAVVIGIVFPWIVSRHWISMKMVFSFSIAVLAITLLCTFFVHQVTNAYIILALLGIPLACANWIPFSLIGQYLEIEKSAVAEHHHSSLSSLSITRHRDSIVAAARHTQTAVDQVVTHNEEQEKPPLPILLETGIILGVHNIYVVIPQFIVAFISSLIFNAVHDKEHNDIKARVIGIAWILQFGGLMAILATVLSPWIDKV